MQDEELERTTHAEACHSRTVMRTQLLLPRAPMPELYPDTGAQGHMCHVAKVVSQAKGQASSSEAVVLIRCVLLLADWTICLVSLELGRNWEGLGGLG